MDGQRFDEFTRQLARGVSRRRVLKGIAGGAAGGVATLLGRSPTGAASRASCGNVVCAGEPEVCNDGCVCCVWSNGNSRCLPSRQCQRMRGDVESPCADDQKRCHGECIDANACCPACEGDAPCINESCCTSGVYDVNAGLCCGADEQICNGSCRAASLCCTDNECQANETCGDQGCFCDTNDHASCGDTCCDTGDVCCTTGDGCSNGCCPEANLCGGVCFANFDADPDNCGSCGNACDTASGYICQQGTCVPPCDDSATTCSNSDDCCPGNHCSDGVCCAAGLTNCDGACVDLASDPNNCNYCGNTCDNPDHGQAACVDSECVAASCESGYSSCDDECCPNTSVCCYGYDCIDTQTDVDNCGDCDNECPAPLHATATCSGGKCGITCEDGYNVCGDFCCLSTLECCNEVCCGEGASCDGATGDCTVQCIGLQSACTDVNACCPSYYIDCGYDADENNICCRNPGGECGSDADCCVVDGYEVTCEDGVCGGTGAYCESYEACADGDCCYGTCCAENQTCTDNGCKLYEGETCTDDHECEYDLCCDNVCVYDQDDENCGACGVVCDADEECYGEDGCLKQGGANCSADSECYPGGKCLEGFCCSECGGYCGDAGPHPVSNNTTCTFYHYPTNLEGICCSGECLNQADDASNCGTCGNTCPLGDSCHEGTCSCTQASSCGTSHYCRDGGLCTMLADGGLACLYLDPLGCGDACDSNDDCSGGKVCGEIGCCGNRCSYVD